MYRGFSCISTASAKQDFQNDAVNAAFFWHEWIFTATPGDLTTFFTREAFSPLRLGPGCPSRQMAGHEMAVAALLQFGRDLPAAWLRRSGSGCGNGSPSAGSSGSARRLAGGSACASPWGPAPARRTAAPACRDAGDCGRDRCALASSTMRPRYITATRSEMCSTTERSWATNR